MPFELEVGLRAITANRRARSTRFISFISLMATLGIALGVAALIVVLSVMNGFQKEVRDRMLGVLSHVELIAAEQGEPLMQAEALLRSDDLVVATAPFTLGQAMAVRDDRLKGVLVRGIDPTREASVSPALDPLQAGALSELKSGAFGAVIGRELAIGLGLGLGDSLVLVSADPAAGPAGILPRMRPFQIVGIFASGHYEYDSSLVLLAQRDAQAFFRSQAIDGVRARLSDQQQARRLAIELEPQLPPGIGIRDWTQENRTWFAAVQLEKRMMFIILMLIIAVAAFNLVSMLVMTVMDKRGDIAILRTLGAQRRSIMAIFMVQGASLGLAGVVTGVGLGVLTALQIDTIVAAVEGFFGFQMLPKGIYFIDSLPSDLRLADVTQIGLVAFGLSLLATVYPSWQASRTDPAEALRHE